MTLNDFKQKQGVDSQRRARGFSLIELMVAMVIALIVLAGVLSSFLASKQAYLYNQEVAFIQENARYAAAYLSADIREAGNFGCSNDSAANS
ncbi:MAG TPA: prepilin-type N-terminal cleavage/methylation domain-containing protein, partial [Spongiibacteraceae bacterium]|nr:prepilin-type N-terminal cleavage/methylation domain-containing protein [Spongiibacteraceae bacterium]